MTPGLGAIAQVQAVRRRLEEAAGARLFADPAWDILVGIWERAARGETPTALTLTAYVPYLHPETMRLHLRRLCDVGLVRASIHPGTRALKAYSLTPCAESAIAEWIAALEAELTPPADPPASYPRALAEGFPKGPNNG